ncbi:MAG: gliding motility-associated C-terminal domain-containing protein [Chitinophagales bacterium]|nr:gliding motility-associated C-terminal domain-containing protein [Bacteroidota bacterium]MBP7398772.1 gliding motility-associated C-terminal domain-containing protein [Chitinophagales bacterium]MBP8753502.1 gliding motility-associated C-terminal domain-containing protein [Chitinophagales bacterium]MBP9188332.1 gliding motility-associated C-terminal domain-containing protein [Chitinophagales bacterium]MBP9548486.1 gliding motility-associated C-terminal domain-containing protein [Chitinophagal
MYGKFIFLFVVILLSYSTFAQSIIVHQDTVICSGDPVTLYAEVDGVLGTLTYEVEEIPFAPEPIGGTSMTMVDDTYLGGYDIGFDFCFFGEVYDEVYICSNGWISFVVPGAGWSTNWTPDGTIPDNAMNVPKAAVMPAWTDWHTGLCANCIHRELLGTAPYRRFVITYEEVPLFSCTGFEGTFQIILYESTNVVEHHLTDVDVCGAWDLGISTEGIHNADGTEAYTVPDRNAEDWSATDNSWRFKPDQITWYELPSATVIGYGDSIVVNPDVTTSYYAEVSFCDGGTLSDTVEIGISTPYDVVYLGHEITCHGESDGWLSLTVTGNSNPVTFTWSTGASTDSIGGLGPGTYSVIVEEEGGCKITLEFELTDPPLLELGIADTQNITCFEGTDGEILLDASGGVPPYIFFLDGNVYTDSLFINLSAGNYIFTVKDQRGCWDTLEIELTQPPEVIVDAGNNLIIPYGGLTQINASTDAATPYNIVWTPTIGLSCTDCINPIASPLQNTSYLLTVIDPNGCIGFDVMDLIVELDLILPNVFTPNGDGMNDNFHVSMDFIESGTMDIYDRWGALILSTSEITRGWDGTKNGATQEIDSYIYIINVITTSGVQIEKSGTITLLR